MNIKGKIVKSPAPTASPAITLSIVWPAIMFAASLKDKLTDLARNAKTSINVTNGESQRGVPLGRKILKKPSPFFKIPKNVTRAKMKTAIPNVTIIWLVTVKPYGNIPRRLQLITNIKNVKTRGKNFIDSLSLIALPINFLKNSNNPSETICIFESGLILRFLIPKLKKIIENKTARIMKRAEFEMLRSIPKIVGNDMIFLISNWASGLSDIMNLNFIRFIKQYYMLK